MHLMAPKLAYAVGQNSLSSRITNRGTCSGNAVQTRNSKASLGTKGNTPDRGKTPGGSPNNVHRFRMGKYLLYIDHLYSQTATGMAPFSSLTHFCDWAFLRGQFQGQGPSIGRQQCLAGVDGTGYTIGV